MGTINSIVIQEPNSDLLVLKKNSIAHAQVVHGSSIVLLDLHSHLCKSLHLFIGGRPAILLLIAGVHRFRSTASLPHGRAGWRI